MDHRSTVCDASGERLELPPGLGRADLQRRRSAAQPDQPVLHAAAAGRAGIEGAGPDRLLVRAIAGAHTTGAGAAVGTRNDAGVYAASDAIGKRLQRGSARPETALFSYKTRSVVPPNPTASPDSLNQPP